jgi:hypothetical protein
MKKDTQELVKIIWGQTLAASTACAIFASSPVKMTLPALFIGTGFCLTMHLTGKRSLESLRNENSRIESRLRALEDIATK